MRKSQLGFARYNRGIASAPLAEKLHFTDTTMQHHADADEASEDGELSYDELKSDLMTIAWNNHESTELEVVDMNGDPVDADDNEREGEDEGYNADDEVRGIRARFAAMTTREQDRFIAKMKVRICSMIGASYFDWQPSDEFILDIIEDETPEDAIYEMARAAYLATPIPCEDNPSDEKEPEQDEGADLIRLSKFSGEYGLPNIGYRFSNRGFWLADRDRRKGPRSLRTRRRSYREYRNSESHCPKYGRQDYRHQAPRIEAKAERRFAAYEAAVEAYFRESYCWELEDDEVRNETNFTEAEMEELNARFDFSEDYFFHEDREICWKMEEMAWAFGHTIDDPCDVAGLPGYRPSDYERYGYYSSTRWSYGDLDQGYTQYDLRGELEPDRGWDFLRPQPRRLMNPFDSYDPFDDYAYESFADSRDERYFDDGFDDLDSCSCAACDSQREFRDLRARFAHLDDDDMGIFEDYGPSEADLDTMQIGQSSSKRRTYHIREMMEKRPALL